MREVKNYEGLYYINEDNDVVEVGTNNPAEVKINKNGEFFVVLIKDGEPKRFKREKLLADNYQELEESKETTNTKMVVGNVDSINSLESEIKRDFSEGLINVRLLAKKHSVTMAEVFDIVNNL